MFKNGDTYYFTGILTGGLREVNTSPKTILLNVMCEGVEFRDHCWVRISKRIMEVIPKSHEKMKVKIAFSARVEEYMSSDGKKQGLGHIRQIVKIGEVKVNARTNTKD